MQREGHVEVTRVERPVARLADHAAGRVDLRERLRKLHEPFEVVHRRLATDVAFADERAAVHRGEDHPVAADTHGLLRVPGLEVERGGGERDLLEDELGIEERDLALDPLARRT